MTYKEFKSRCACGCIAVAAEDIPGFAKKGASLYGDCDDLSVVRQSLEQELGIYTVFLANPA